MWIDSHCHLNHSRITEAGTASELIKRAHDNGIDGMVTICCRIAEELDELLQITAENDNVWCSIGTHPHDASKETEKAITADQILKHIKDNMTIVGVGESGLDYYYNYSTPEDQAQSFCKHIGVAKESGLPLIIHTRDAEDDTMKILREEGACDGKTKVLMHCFSSNEWLARQSIDEGFYMSFSGMVTFKRNVELQEIVKMVPNDKLLVETDAPFLAPEPHRGKINEPAFVKHTGEFVAQLKEMSSDECAALTSQNFKTLFSRI